MSSSSDEDYRIIYRDEIDLELDQLFENQIIRLKEELQDYANNFKMYSQAIDEMVEKPDDWEMVHKRRFCRLIDRIIIELKSAARQLRRVLRALLKHLKNKEFYNEEKNYEILRAAESYNFKANQLLGDLEDEMDDLKIDWDRLKRQRIIP